MFSKALVDKSVWNVIQGSGLWIQIVVQKYVYHLSLLEWIRSSVKQKRSMSICWKAILWSFDIIGNNLVQKIGNRVEVRLGLDPWVGCKWRHVLPQNLVEKLHSVGVFSLQDIGIPVTSVLEQAWLPAEYIGLVEHEDVSSWNFSLSLLKASQVRLSNVNDKLVWNLSKSIVYSPKEGYLHLLDRSELEVSWWWKVLWKLKCPIKAKKNCWFLF